MKKAIVFGATGQLGCYSALALKEQGYDVVAVGRRKQDGGFSQQRELNLLGMYPSKSRNVLSYSRLENMMQS